jgi:hypothetical protein
MTKESRFHPLRFFWRRKAENAINGTSVIVARVILVIHFRIEQMEAVLEGWSMKLLSAVQSRSVSSSRLRAM